VPSASSSTGIPSQLKIQTRTSISMGGFSLISQSFAGIAEDTGLISTQQTKTPCSCELVSW
jgi:hypothetical protein